MLKINFRQKFVWGFIIFAIAILITFLASAIFQDNYEMLFSNLTKDEEARGLSKLEAYGIKKEFKDGVILVKKGARENILMRLSADKALPDDKSSDFLVNITKGETWTDTEKNKRLKLKFAIENELTRIIENSEKVSSVKVLLSNNKKKEKLGESIQLDESDKRTAIITVILKMALI